MTDDHLNTLYLLSKSISLHTYIQCKHNYYKSIFYFSFFYFVSLLSVLLLCALFYQFSQFKFHSPIVHPKLVFSSFAYIYNKQQKIAYITIEMPMLWRKYWPLWELNHVISLSLSLSFIIYLCCCCSFRWTSLVHVEAIDDWRWLCYARNACQHIKTMKTIPN